MRKIVLICLLMSLILISGCVQERVEEKEPIKIALNPWIGYAHSFIAQEKGFFEKNNVDVELILKEEYLEAQEMYTDGGVEGIFQVYSDTLIQDSQGIKTKVVYIADYSDTEDVIIGKPEFNSLADLKGKKIGIVGINSFAYIFVLTALEKAGLKEGDVYFEIIPVPDTLKLIKEGKIDAGHTWASIAHEAVDEGYKILGKAGDVPGIITDVLSFSSKSIAERPEDIQAIVKSMIEARDFIYNNREEALEIMSKEIDMTKEEANEAVEGIHFPNSEENIESMEKSEDTKSLYGSGEIIARFYLERGQLTSIPDFDEIIEPRFVNNIR